MTALKSIMSMKPAPPDGTPSPKFNHSSAQIGVKPHELAGYAETDVTRRRHLIDLLSIYGYKMFSGRGARDLKAWLEGEAETAHSSEGLVKRFIGECRRTHTILPGVSIIERLCTDALVAAERRIETRIVGRLNDAMKDQLDAQLTERYCQVEHILSNDFNDEFFST